MCFEVDGFLRKGNKFGRHNRMQINEFYWFMFRVAAQFFAGRFNKNSTLILEDNYNSYAYVGTQITITRSAFIRACFWWVWFFVMRLFRVV